MNSIDKLFLLDAYALIYRACDGFFLLASFRGTARRTADSQKQNCAQGQSQQNPMGCFTFHINTPFHLYSAIVS